jgi:hypothetical protein
MTTKQTKNKVAFPQKYPIDWGIFVALTSFTNDLANRIQYIKLDFYGNLWYYTGSGMTQRQPK